MTQELFLISEVAKRLNVAPSRIAYQFVTRKIEEPSLRMGNRRIFTHDDARRIANALGLTWDNDVSEDER